MPSPREVTCDVPPEIPEAVPGTASEVTTLAGHLRNLSQDIIDEEMARLTRKAPSMNEADLRRVTRVLHDLVERLLVGRAAALPHREPQLRDLFGLPTISAAPVDVAKLPPST